MSNPRRIFSIVYRTIFRCCHYNPSIQCELAILHTPSTNVSVVPPSLETILSSRLLLNLRRLSDLETNQTTIRISASNEVQFVANSFLGNIGAPLRSADEERDDLIVDGGDIFERSNEITDA